MRGVAIDEGRKMRFTLFASQLTWVRERPNWALAAGWGREGVSDPGTTENRICPTGTGYR